MRSRFVSRVMWFGRATVFIVGMITILALALGTTAIALAGTGIGATFNLGELNRVDAISRLVGSVSGGSLLIDNNQAGGSATALDLRVEPGLPPMRVTSNVKVTKLNADLLDGAEASDLAEPRGYAHVADQGAIDNAYASKGVNGVVIPAGQTSLYCFDLVFTPKTAIGSPFLTNSAVVATVTPPNTTLTGSCPAGFQDAAAKTYGSSTGTDVPINFMIVFN